LFSVRASFANWLVILARHELSVAYPTAIGLTLAVFHGGGGGLLGRAAQHAEISGITLIFLGILLVTR
jgi:hypothetical protein